MNLISGSKSPNGVPVQLLMTAAGSKGQQYDMHESGMLCVALTCDGTSAYAAFYG
jgi:hypothetical protein